MDQITIEKLNQQLIDISTVSSPYYKQNDRRKVVARLQYQIAKLRGENDDDEQDVDDATIKRNLGKLKAFFGRKQQEFKEQSK